MKIKIIAAFILLACLRLTSIAQTNIVTIMGDGDFETAGSEDDLYENVVPFVYPFETEFPTNASQYSGWQLERVSTRSYSGSYSLKCTTTTNDSGDNVRLLLSKQFDFFEAGKDYFVRARINVPSSGGVPVNTQITPMISSSNNYLGTQIGTCATTDYPGKPAIVGHDSYDQWIEVYARLDHTYTTNNHSLQFVLLVSPVNSPGTFYLDKVEIFEELKPSPEFIVTPSTLIKGEPMTITPTNHQSSYTYSYSFGNGSGSSMTQEGQVTFTYEDAGEYDVTCNMRTLACQYTYHIPIIVKDLVPLCETIIPLTSAGEIKLDKFSGRYVFQLSGNCLPDIGLGCIQGKMESQQFKNVVSASATTFSDNWEQSMTGAAVERGAQGKWRPQATYAYNKGAVSVDKNLNSGKFQLSHFNWQYPEVAQKAGWLKVNEITKYSAHGDAIEEKNALDIMSAAKFGYTNTVPYMIAQNADYNSILFESFENIYSNLLEDNMELSGGTRDENVQHSGKYSLKLEGQFVSRTFLRGDLDDKGILVRLWAKVSEAAPFELMLSAPGHSLPTASFTSIARSGEWSLWEARVPPGGLPLQTEESNFAIWINKLAAGDVWIDDVRIQPLDAEATCYVYDVNTLKLLASFDDQHFALFYQYNAEGKLVRKMIETERGIKTVQETQYNTPEVNKSSFIGQ